MAMIDPDRPVAEIMNTWPQTARLFLENRMNCIGCVMSVFDTVNVACATYKLDLGDFLEQLDQIILSNQENERRS